MKSARWTDLPDDLLRAIYPKITGLLHRVRFAAACRSWRAAAVASRQAVPPALPWLVISNPKDDRNSGNMKSVYCPEDGGVVRIRLPSEAIGKHFVGSHDGGWVAMQGPNLELAVMNLFSGIEVPLPAIKMSQRVPLWKVVFSESPTSRGCIMAAMASDINGIAICRICYPDNGWTIKQIHGALLLHDVIFYNGLLYGITIGELLKFEIGVHKHHGSVVIGEPHRFQVRMCNAPFVYPDYIVMLHGKLALEARIWHGISREPSFKAFKLVDDSTTRSATMWEEVMSLDDCALFLGGKWSKAVHIPTTGRGEVRRSCVYPESHVDGVYPLQESNSVMPRIKSAGSYVVTRLPRMWILPPNF